MISAAAGEAIIAVSSTAACAGHITRSTCLQPVDIVVTCTTGTGKVAGYHGAITGRTAG